MGRAEILDWGKALQSLSVRAYHLLSVIALTEDDKLSNQYLCLATDCGMSTLVKYKRELKEEGYLKVVQIGKGVYKYSIGDNINE